jgi:large subunit ribosomal protein L4
MPKMNEVPASSLKATVVGGSGSKTRDLPEQLFGGKVNPPLMHQVMVAQLAAARAGTAYTKTRAEVRGGGAKPWRQKGTGRARHGSMRSPLWVGGGVIFGPKPRSYVQRTPKKMKKAALRSALADKALAGEIYVLDAFDEVKTKAAAQALADAGIEGKVLIVLDPKEEASMKVDRAFRNLSRVAFSLYGSLSTYDVLVADSVMFTSGALDSYGKGGASGSEEEDKELELESSGGGGVR